MGIFDTYCIFCGGPQTSDFIGSDDILESLKEVHNIDISYDKLEYDTKWLNNLLFLTDDNKVLEGYSYASIGGVFDNAEGDSISMVEANKIFMVHVDCMNYLKKLNFNEILSKNIKLDMNDMDEIVKIINYGGAEKYFNQFYDLEKCILDKNYWMLISPLDKENGEKNRNRIKKIAEQLLIEHDEKKIKRLTKRKTKNSSKKSTKRKTKNSSKKSIKRKI
jgi:hypothetical protein